MSRHLRSMPHHGRGSCGRPGRKLVCHNLLTSILLHSMSAMNSQQDFAPEHLGCECAILESTVTFRTLHKGAAVMRWEQQQTPIPLAAAGPHTGQASYCRLWNCVPPGALHGTLMPVG